MNPLKRILLTAVTVICCFIEIQGIDDYTDLKRPYEFGFTIDGQQHRHEKKDKNGIIMGEFGFITADDVYHVTVYATDENGRFKILSMKNIHLKSSPASRQGHSLQLPVTTTPTSLSKLTTTYSTSGIIPNQFAQKPQSYAKPLLIEPPANSCSHCSLPTTSTQAPKVSIPGNSQTSIINYNNNPVFPKPSTLNNIQNSPGAITSTNYPLQQNYISLSPSLISAPPNPYNQPSIPFGSQVSTKPPLFQSSRYPQQISSGPQYSQPINLVPYNSQGKLESHPAQKEGFTSGSFGSTNSPNIQATKRFNGPQYQPEKVIPFQGPNNPEPISNETPYSKPFNSVSYSPQGKIENITPVAPEPVKYPLPNSQAQTGVTSYPGSRTAKQFSPTPLQPIGFSQKNNPQNNFNAFSGSEDRKPDSKKPTLVSAQIQVVDKNTDIHYKRPGEKQGLPEGLTENDMMQLLYTFNYTLGFQAHYEEGYTNGFKQGYYYVTGRNGVRTRIDYTADDKGFHPKISQDVLDLLSDDVPKPETEKDEKYGLRGYDFKWLYYPVEPKSQ